MKFDTNQAYVDLGHLPRRALLMRDVRDQQLVRRVHEHDALHMRRLADVVIASILLAITATSKASG
jgi:hypothetical protein